MLTRSSVVWADRIVAVSSSYGLRWCRAQMASGYSTASRACVSRARPAGVRGRGIPLPCRTVLSIRATPDDIDAVLARSEAVRRLTAGDALDQAMNGAALLGAVVAEARALGASALELKASPAGEV